MSPWPTTAPRSRQRRPAAPPCAPVDRSRPEALHGNRLSDGPIQRQIPRADAPPTQPTARGDRPREHATVRPRRSRSRSRRHARGRSPILSLVGDGARADRAPRSTRCRPMQAHAPRRAPASAPLARSKRRPSRRHSRPHRRRCAPTPLPKTSQSATTRHTPEIGHRQTQKERRMTSRLELPTLPVDQPCIGSGGRRFLEAEVDPIPLWCCLGTDAGAASAADKNSASMGGCRKNHSKRRCINWSWDTTMPRTKQTSV
jgi:hypothetical protein